MKCNWKTITVRWELIQNLVLGLIYRMLNILSNIEMMGFKSYSYAHQQIFIFIANIDQIYK